MKMEKGIKIGKILVPYGVFEVNADGKPITRVRIIKNGIAKELFE